MEQFIEFKEPVYYHPYDECYIDRFDGGIIRTGTKSPNGDYVLTYLSYLDQTFISQFDIDGVLFTERSLMSDEFNTIYGIWQEAAISEDIKGDLILYSERVGLDLSRFINKDSPLITTNEMIDIINTPGNILTFEQACIFSGLSKSYLYKLTSAQKIPHYKPSGKLIYFNREELEAWLLSNRISTSEELEIRAQAYCISNKIGGKK